MTSTAMAKIRKIRDDNSECRLNMTMEEHKKEIQEIMNWFSQVSKGPIKYTNQIR